MSSHAIYTIGHGTRPIADLLHLLKDYSIEFLVDVRSIPYSAYNPQYRQDLLAQALLDAGIKYVYLGRSLGGRPTDPTCYNINGHVDYEKVSTKEFFITGLARIITAYEMKIRIALLCSESKPENCHRSKLIGRSLDKHDIPVLHIDEKGQLRPQQQLFHHLLF